MINLSQREKKLLQMLGVFVGELVLYFFIITPVIDFKSNIDDEYILNQKRLSRLDDIYFKYRELKNKKDNYNKLLKDNKGISTLIEENATKANIISNKVYNRDHQSNLQNKMKKITTDVKFEGVDIKSILDFIYKMENSNKLLKVSYLRINQAIKEHNNYDVTIKFDSYKRD